jgi:hypothetical protein
MKCLTVPEGYEWLNNHRITPTPYGMRHIPKEVRYMQFAPISSCNPDFVDKLFGAFGVFQGGLLNLEDWSWQSDIEVDPTAKIRNAHDERRPVIDAPGRLFEAGEAALAIELSSLVVSRGWTAYLYLALNDATVLFWEGELIDFYGYDRNVTYRVRIMIAQNRLRVVHDFAG